MSSSAVRRVKENSGGGVGGAKVTIVPSSKTSRNTTSVSERIICRGGDSINVHIGKENASSCRATSRVRAAVKPQKPLVPPIVRADKDCLERRARWSTNNAVRSRGRSSSPSEFNRVTSDVRKPRVSRVSVDRNERSVSVDRPARVSDMAVQQNKAPFKYSNLKISSDSGVTSSKTSAASLEKNSEIGKASKSKPVKTENARVSTVLPKSGREREIASHQESSNTDPPVKVSESVKLFEKFKSKSCVGLRPGNANEYDENGVRSSLRDSGGKLSSRGSSLDGLKEKQTTDDGLSARTATKYPSKLHGKLAFLEEKVKRIASDIKRTKEMLELNNPDASKVMLSDIQETVAGIEKAMGDVVIGEKEKGAGKDESDSLQISATKKPSPIKDSSDTKSLAEGLNNDELEARFFPHHKLLRDRTTLKAHLVSHQIIKTEADAPLTASKQEAKSSSANDEVSDCLSKGESKVTTEGGLDIYEVQETNSSVANARGSSNLYDGKGDIERMLTANEALEDCNEQEKEGTMIFEEEIDECCNNQLNEIGHKTATGGWFVSEGESVLLAHDDGSCTFYDVPNSEEKSVYKAPPEVSHNLWRDCWILRASGPDGCSNRYVVAASAGNCTDSGFCSWDFYTKEVRAFHVENGVANTRTALAPLPNNVLNRRQDCSNMTPENRQWWYKPCSPLIISTATNQKVVRIYDIRDGEHIMRWELQNPVLAMDNSSPLQWRNRGKVVVAEAESLSLWDVGSLTPAPLLSVSSSGKKISALHVNNTDAELGGGVRQRASSTESEGNDGVFCTSDSINVLDFRHPSGIGLKIPKYSTTVHSVFSRGDSIYLGCSGAPSATTRKQTSNSQIQQFSLRKPKLFGTYMLPESNAHAHYTAITQVWGNSDLAMGVCGLGLFVFDALNDDGLQPYDYESGQKVRDVIGPDNLYCPSFDYLGSRALLISRDRPASWKYLSSVMEVL